MFICKGILTCRTIQIGWPWSYLSDPVSIDVWWNDKTDMAEPVKNRSNGMFCAVLITGNHNTANFVIIDGLALVVCIAARAV